MGWTNFVQHKRGRGDLASLTFHHPAQPFLRHLKHNSVPVILSSPPWSNQRQLQALHRGPHRSCFAHLNFLEEEFINMIAKDQWVILPLSVAQHIPNLRLSPPGVVPQRDRRPRWIGDYSWSGINNDTQPLSPHNAMQFGFALDRFLQELLLADPSLGPLYLLKLDIADGFYRINLAPPRHPQASPDLPHYAR